MTYLWYVDVPLGKVALNTWTPEHLWAVNLLHLEASLLWKALNLLWVNTIVGRQVVRVLSLLKAHNNKYYDNALR